MVWLQWGWIFIQDGFRRLVGDIFVGLDKGWKGVIECIGVCLYQYFYFFFRVNRDGELGEVFVFFGGVFVVGKD